MKDKKKIKILKDCAGSNDGINITEYKKDDVVFINSGLANSLVSINEAEYFIKEIKEVSDKAKSIKPEKNVISLYEKQKKSIKKKKEGGKL